MSAPGGCQRKRTRELPKCSKRLHFADEKVRESTERMGEDTVNPTPENSRSSKVLPVLKPKEPLFLCVLQDFAGLFGSLGASDGTDKLLEGECS